MEISAVCWLRDLEAITYKLVDQRVQYAWIRDHDTWITIRGSYCESDAWIVIDCHNNLIFHQKKVNVLRLVSQILLHSSTTSHSNLSFHGDYVLTTMAEVERTLFWSLSYTRGGIQCLHYDRLILHFALRDLVLNIVLLVFLAGVTATGLRIIAEVRFPVLQLLTAHFKYLKQERNRRSVLTHTIPA